MTGLVCWDGASVGGTGAGAGTGVGVSDGFLDGDCTEVIVG